MPWLFEKKFDPNIIRLSWCNFACICFYFLCCIIIFIYFLSSCQSHDWNDEIWIIQLQFIVFFSLKNNNLHFNLITWQKKLFFFRIGTSVWISINHLIAWSCIISLYHSNSFCKHNSTFYQDKIPCKFSISMGQ